MTILRIGIDIDDVVCDHIKHLVKYYNETHEDSVPLDAISTWEVVNHLPKMYGDVKKLDTVWNSFMDTEDFTNLPSIKDSVDIINTFGVDNKIFFITARNPVLCTKTYDWMHKNNLIDYPIYFTKNKGDLARRLKLDVHLDDGVHNLDSIVKQSPGTVPLLYTAPWNTTNKSYVRCNDWKDVYSELSILQLNKIHKL